MSFIGHVSEIWCVCVYLFIYFIYPYQIYIISVLWSLLQGRSIYFLCFMVRILKVHRWQIEWDRILHSNTWCSISIFNLISIQKDFSFQKGNEIIQILIWFTLLQWAWLILSSTINYFTVSIMIYDDSLYIWLGMHNKNWTISGNYKSQDSFEKFLFKNYCFWIALNSEKKNCLKRINCTKCKVRILLNFLLWSSF